MCSTENRSLRSQKVPENVPSLSACRFHLTERCCGRSSAPWSSCWTLGAVWLSSAPASSYPTLLKAANTRLHQLPGPLLTAGPWLSQLADIGAVSAELPAPETGNVLPSHLWAAHTYLFFSSDQRRSAVAAVEVSTFPNSEAPTATHLQ